jgi:predicted kinase
VGRREGFPGQNGGMPGGARVDGGGDGAADEGCSVAPDPTSPEQPRPFVVLVTGLQGTGKSTAAAAAARFLHAPVLSHDWAMSALRPFPEIQSALDDMEPSGHRVVGWSIVFSLARSELRRRSSVVLDGLARTADIEHCRELARDEGAGMVLVVTECADLAVHRSRVEGRLRRIPNWYELEWGDVEHSRTTWEPPGHPDITLEATADLSDNADRLIDLLRTL